MSFKLNEATVLSILIEDQELPLTGGNVLHFLHIATSSRSILPILNFSFTDLLQVVPMMKLQDGAKITVYIKSTAAYTRIFRVHSWHRSPAGDGFSYSVSAYWNSVKYWAGTASTSLPGTSSSVLESIANTCGLTYASNNTKTADKMAWLPQNKTYGTFARDIAKFGFSSETSHMALGIDSQGVMRYRDLNAKNDPEIVVGYLPPKDSSNFLLLSDFQATNNAGIGNALLGYRHNRQVPSVVGGYKDPATGKSRSEESAVVLSPDSKYPSINGEVRKEQGRGLYSYAPVNFGNVHLRYERARYQNARYDMIKSMQGEVLFPFQTNFELFDTFKYVAPPDMNNNEYNGKYTVGAKIIYIEGSTYQEKLVAFRDGLEA